MPSLVRSTAVLCAAKKERRLPDNRHTIESKVYADFRDIKMGILAILNFQALFYPNSNI